MSNYKNILLIKPSALGDVVLSLCAFNSLRKSFPQAKISWLIRPEFAQIFEGSPSPDELVIFDRKKMGKWYRSPSQFAEFRKLLARLRKARYDLVIDLQGLFRTAFFALITGCPNRFGLESSRECSRFFYTRRIGSEGDLIHLVDLYNRLVRETGAENIVTQTELRPHPRAVQKVQALLSENDLVPGSYAVFVPGAAQDYKLWPVENFAELARGIGLNYGLKIVAVGTENQTALIDQIKFKSDVPVINLAGRTDIQQLMAVIQNSALTVSNDTGPGHIAWAMGKNIVMIFGPTNPARVGPYQNSYASAAVNPMQRGHCIEDHNYKIQDVTVEMVYNAVESVMQSKGPEPGN